MPSLSLPIPPTVNHYWARNARGGVRISQDGERFRQHVAIAVLEASVPRMEKPERIRLHADVWYPDARVRDLDNSLKSLLDALGKAEAWDDDSQIDDLRIVRRGVDRDDPRVEVHWEAIA